MANGYEISIEFISSNGCNIWSVIEIYLPLRTHIESLRMMTHWTVSLFATSDNAWRVLTLYFLAVWFS